MGGQLTPDDVHRMTVDQISRRIFSLLPHLGDHFSQPLVRQRLFIGSLGPDLDRKVVDAFFRLQDRNLIRWWGGDSSVTANYMLTERGRSSRFGDGVIDDPEPFVGDVEARIAMPLDPVIKQYLTEAVTTFHYGRLLSAQFCLGAVAERVAFLVRDWLAPLVPSGKKLESIELVGQVVAALPKVLADVKKERADWERQIDAFTDLLESCASVYRRSRNELGHPTEVRSVDEEETSVMMSAMRTRYIPAAYALLALQP